MITKENEADRFNEGKSKFSLIDFNMFAKMYTTFKEVSTLNTSAKCIKKMIQVLSGITHAEETVVYEVYIPVLQAIGYKMSLLYTDNLFIDSDVYDLRAFESMAQVLEYGEKKYSRNNWKKGYEDKFSTADSLYRHLRQLIIGEDNDKESGIHHMGHIMCNIMFLTNDLLYVNRDK